MSRGRSYNLTSTMALDGVGRGTAGAVCTAVAEHCAASYIAQSWL